MAWLSLVAASVLWAAAPAGAAFPPGTVFLSVDANGGDYQTLGGALEAAHRSDDPVVINVAAGTYREGDLRVHRRAAPLWILGDAEGQTIISGSDVWTDWEPRGDQLVAPWPHDWGDFEFNDPLWLDSDRKTLRPAGARSELVFVDGERLTQVIDASEMRPGTYRVDLDAKELVVELPEGTDPGAAQIEVGMRPNLLTMLQPKGVTLRHLTFQHATSHIPREGSGPFDRWGVAIFGEHKPGLSNAQAGRDRTFAQDITLEHCRFILNNRAGLTVANTKGLVIRHCVFSDNGYMGIGANRCRGVLIEDSKLNRNAWRLGDLGNAMASLPAGTKMLFMYELTLRRCQVNDKYSAGLWFDTSVNFLVVDDCEMRGNWGTGFYYEHCQGPALLKDSVVADNGRNDGTRLLPIDGAGVLFAESQDLAIDNCRIIDNTHIQVGVRSLDRPGKCYWTGRFIDGSSRRLTLVNSRVRGSAYAGENVQDFFTDAHRLSTLVGRHVHSKEALYVRDFTKAYVASGNSYHNPVSESVFATGPKWGHTRVTLSGWQELTGQDLDSVWEAGE